MIRKLRKWFHDHHIPVRLVLSVAAGIVFSKVLTVITHEILHLAGVLPPLDKPMFDRKMLLISLSFHSVYAVSGAYITAGIAREKAGKAVFILGSKEAILWIIGIILLWKHSPPWFNIAKAALGFPLCILGGKVYAWRKAKNPSSVS
jgi:hypothetical protein